MRPINVFPMVAMLVAIALLVTLLLRKPELAFEAQRLGISVDQAILQMGVSAILPKPFNLPELIDIIEHLS